MHGREDFTTPEWQTLQTAIICVAKYVSLTNKGLLQDYLEKFSGSRALNDFSKQYPSNFTKDIIDFENYRSPLPEHADETLGAIQQPMTLALKESLAILQAKDADLITIYKNLIQVIANDVAGSVGGTSTQENTAIDYIKSILKEPIIEKPGFKYQL